MANKKPDAWDYALSRISSKGGYVPDQQASDYINSSNDNGNKMNSWDYVLSRTDWKAPAGQRYKPDQNEGDYIPTGFGQYKTPPAPKQKGFLDTLGEGARWAWQNLITKPDAAIRALHQQQLQNIDDSVAKMRADATIKAYKENPKSSLRAIQVPGMPPVPSQFDKAVEQNLQAQKAKNYIPVVAGSFVNPKNLTAIKEGYNGKRKVSEGDISNKIMNIVYPGENHPIAKGALGAYIGMTDSPMSLLPIVGAEKTIGTGLAKTGLKLAPKVLGSPLGQTALKGLGTGVGYGTIEGIGEGKSAKDTAINAVKQGALFGGLGVAGYGVSKLVPKLRPLYTAKADLAEKPALALPEPSIKKSLPSPSIKPALEDTSGKFAADNSGNIYTSKGTSQPTRLFGGLTNSELNMSGDFYLNKYRQSGDKTSLGALNAINDEIKYRGNNAPSVKKYTLKPKYDAGQAEQALNDAIQQAQNEVGHWDVGRPSETQTLAEKYNIPNLLDNYQQATSPPNVSDVLNKKSNLLNWKRVTGISDIPNLSKIRMSGALRAQGIPNQVEIPQLKPKLNLKKAPITPGIKPTGINTPKLSGTVPTDQIKAPLAESVGSATVKGGKLPGLSKTNNILPNLSPGTPKDTIGQIVSANGKKPGNSLWEKLNNFYTRTVDTQRPISRFSKDYTPENAGLNPKILASNARNSAGITSQILKNGLVDKTGKAIGDSYKSVIDSIPKGQDKAFSDYLLHKHNISRMAQEKPVFGDNVTADVSKAKVAEYEKAHPEYKQLSGKLNTFINNFMNTWGEKSGLLSKEQIQAMRKMYPDYVPTYREFSNLEKGSSPFSKNGKGFVGQNSGVKKATGSDRPIIDPLESIMGMVDRTVKAAKYNEVGQSIVDAVRKNPEKLSKWAEIVPTKPGEDVNSIIKNEGIDGFIENHVQQYDRAFNKPSLNKDNVVRVMENGQPVYLKINDKSFLDAVKGLTQSNQSDIEKAFRKGTGIFKALITGKNPFFAIKNISRDIPTAYVNGSEKNPAKFLADLLGSAKDMATNAPLFNEYKALGGGNSNFFSQDKNLLKNGKGLLGKAGDKIELFNNATETLPRYAEFKRTVKQGWGDYASKQQGLFNANDVTTNFNRNGDITKSADAYVPYLNPGVQGLDKLVRQFRYHPIGTVLKGATAVTAPTLILNEINKNDPNYQALDNRTKDNYFLFPTGNGTFFKVPKSREIGVLFGSLAERTLRAMSGAKEPFKDFGNTVLTNFAPANPFESNFFSPAVTNLPKNKDFANRSIVPENMKDRSPKNQYDETTSEIAKKIGEITGYSPKKVDYLIKSYTGIIGQLALPATTKSNYANGSPLGKITKPITTQFTADPLYSNNTMSDFYDNYDKLKVRAADKNFLGNIPSKKVTQEEALRNKFAKASKTISDLSKQSRQAEQSSNKDKVKELRRLMLKRAEETNRLMK